MPNASKPHQEKTNIRLLKRTKVTEKDGLQHVFHNLFIQVGDGQPIAIDLPKALYNPKVKRFLLAIAEEFTPSIIVKSSEETLDEKDF